MKRTLPLLILAGLLAAACNRDPHFISDSGYRKLVSKQFESQKALAANRSEALFGVMEQELTRTEREAMMFLYAFMPLSDLADYDGAFYLANVRASLAARDTFSWGKSLPEELFRHFVLPIRVNNENLDTSRMVFFRELKDRVKNLPMKDAVLEINHWCHEKVTYKGTDGRTSSPLSTVKTAFGRCGEESTFTVAALRAAGIPARQCYTPRWAHSDDNHAWVEVWADGSWYFIGACEPEPALNMAWFTAPAKRAMLVNTNVFGVYQGPEDKLIEDTRYTKINVLANYTETKRIVARVVDSLMQPVDSADVEFQLYNYAEFYPLHRTKTDAQGFASLLTGKGDLLLWAAKGERFGFSRADVRTMDTVTVVLAKKAGYTDFLLLDFVPPAAQEVTTEVSDSARKANSERLAFEDKLRSAYEATFIDSAEARRVAGTFRLNPDTLWGFLKKSRGNWREIIDFISAVKAENKQWIFPLLSAISEKDLRDAAPEVLKDHLAFGFVYQPLSDDPAIVAQYVLNPRFDNEYLKPWKQFFQENLPRQFGHKARARPEMIVEWIETNIALDATANYGRAPITPRGVYELKVADKPSRNMLFVALCRTFGIPARIEPATKIPQYLGKGVWKDVVFDDAPEAEAERATLVLENDPENKRNPEYYIHYTVEELKNGFYRSLDYEYDPALKSFPASVRVPAGSYLMVTGNRLADGTVLASLNFFSSPPANETRATITLRRETGPVPVYGTLDLKKIFTTPPADGFILAFLEPDREPTKHLLADLQMKQRELEQWKGRIILVCPTEQEMEAFIGKYNSMMPANTSYSFRSTMPMEGILPLLKSGGRSLPVVLFVNPNGEVNFLSEGYRIGTGDELVKLTRR